MIIVIIKKTIIIIRIKNFKKKSIQLQQELLGQAEQRDPRDDWHQHTTIN